jgi:hypothetical protein
VIPAEYGEILEQAQRLAAEHTQTWVDKPAGYWGQRIREEAGEVADSLVGQHHHPASLEIRQLAAILLNAELHRFHQWSDAMYLAYGNLYPSYKSFLDWQGVEVK